MTRYTGDWGQFLGGLLIIPQIKDKISLYLVIYMIVIIILCEISHEI